MGKFQRSWNLLKCSLRVVGENPKLLLFPILIFMLTILIALFFLAPIAFWNAGHALTEQEHWKSLPNSFVQHKEAGDRIRFNGAGYALAAGLYLISMFLATFFNVAFFNEILHALNGQAVSIRGGLRFALSRLKAILMWSLLAGLVGLIIKAIEERVGFVGRIVMKLIGITWSVASVFAIPVIIREEKHANPFLFLKTSADILKKTWGESLIGYLGIHLSGLLMLLGSLVFLAVGIFLGVSLKMIWLAFVFGAVWLLGLFVFFYLLNIASQVYRGALFIYATEGVVPGPFEQDQMDMAWKIKSGRKAL